MKIRHMIAAGLLIGASTVQAAPVTTTSNVAGWTIQDDGSSWLPFFAPVLSTGAEAGAAAGAEFSLLKNGSNGIVVHLTSMANVLGIGLFVKADGTRQHGFILKDPVAAAPAGQIGGSSPAAGVPAAGPVHGQAPGNAGGNAGGNAAPVPTLPTPVFEPVASNGESPAASNGSVADEVAGGAGATQPLIDNVQGDTAVVAAPAADPNAVPEPATGMLLLAGLAGSALFARRRQR